MLTLVIINTFQIFLSDLNLMERAGSSLIYPNLINMFVISILRWNLFHLPLRTLGMHAAKLLSLEVLFTLIDKCTLITNNCHFASVDLKDEYYSVPIAVGHRKYSRFMWKSELYEFTCLPNGLPCAKRLFIKLMKHVFPLCDLQDFYQLPI